MLVSGQQSYQFAPSLWRGSFRAPSIRLLLQILLLNCSVNTEEDKQQNLRQFQDNQTLFPDYFINIDLFVVLSVTVVGCLINDADRYFGKNFEGTIGVLSCLLSSNESAAY